MTTHDSEVAQELIKDAYLLCNSPATAEMLINVAHKMDNSINVPVEFSKWMDKHIENEYQRRAELGYT